MLDEHRVYSAPLSSGRNEWALIGDWGMWLVAPVVEEPSAVISLDFHARGLHLGDEARPIRAIAASRPHDSFNAFVLIYFYFLICML